MLVDFYTPWVLFESPMYEQYHNFLISRLDERPEMPLIEIPAEEASFDKIAKLTKGFTWFWEFFSPNSFFSSNKSYIYVINRPLVIRGLLKNSTGLENWFYKLYSLNFITYLTVFYFHSLYFFFILFLEKGPSQNGGWIIILKRKFYAELYLKSLKTAQFVPFSRNWKLENHFIFPGLQIFLISNSYWN